MTESNDDFKSKVETYGIDSLYEILGNINKEKYPERYEIVKNEIARRKENPEIEINIRNDPNSEYGKPRKELKGIGGWLILPLIGFAVSPVLCVYYLFQLNQIDFNKLQSVFENPSSAYYFPKFIPYFIFLFILLVIFFFVSIWGLIALLRKRKYFPRFVSIFYICCSILALINFIFWLFYCPDFPESTGNLLSRDSIISKAVISFISVSIGSIIWVSYFSRSERVANTFIEKSGPNDKLGFFPYLVAFLSLIPFLGLIFALISIIWGRTTKQRGGQRLVFIGLIGIIITMSLCLYAGILRIHNFKTKRIGNTQKVLVELVNEVERYKTIFGVYPDSLAQLDRITDRIVNLSDDFGRINYSKIDSGYTIFSSGVDKIPNTKDDIYPNIALVKGAYGLRLKGFNPIKEEVFQK